MRRSCWIGSGRRRAGTGTLAGSPLIIAASLLMLALASPLWARQASLDPLQRAASNRARGEERAPVLIFEISDFQCPYCARFTRDIFPLIDSVYIRTGKVQWVFVNLPLPAHRNAWGASEAALCAGAISTRFWPMHQRLFSDQEEWAAALDPMPLFLGYARDLDIPAEPFRNCLISDRMAPLLLEDVIFAASSRVSGTPTYIINRERRVVGFKNFEEWRELIETALRRR